LKRIIQHISNKNPFWLGFFISFLGSIPLGYLNVIGLEILLEQGYVDAISFISGVVIIEFFVLWVVSKLAKWLLKQRKLLLFVDVFTIVFFLGIAYYFYTTYNTGNNFSLKQLQLAKYPIVLGLVLNSLNFMQWPYWSGMYLYLFRTKKLIENRKSNLIFILGALIGTYVGMLTFTYIGEFVLEDDKAIFSLYLNLIFAFLFLVLGLIQLGQFSVKQYRIKHI
jgi:hypothetical protein